MTLGEFREMTKDMPDETPVAYKIHKHEWISISQNDIELKMLWSPDKHNHYEFYEYASDDSGTDIQVLTVGE